MKIYNAKWTSTSAGPSPYNNYRTEIFFIWFVIERLWENHVKTALILLYGILVNA